MGAHASKAPAQINDICKHSVREGVAIKGQSEKGGKGKDGKGKGKGGKGKGKGKSKEYTLYVADIPKDLDWKGLKDGFKKHWPTHSDVGEIKNGIF